jgi:ketosteroid isomerase-like protein
MIDHPNSLLARQSWQAVADSDVETLKALWSPDVVWHVTSNNRWRGDHVGHDAVLEYLAQVGEAGDTYDAALEDVLVSDDRIAMVFSVKTRRGQHELETSYMLAARVRDGQLVEIWSLPFEPMKSGEFWTKTHSSAPNHPPVPSPPA